MEKNQYIKFAKETSDLVAPAIYNILNEIVEGESELSTITSFFIRKDNLKYS